MPRWPVASLVEDNGPGFDFNRYLSFDQKRSFDAHGRGILLARAAVGVEYFEPGNLVRVTLPLQGDGDTDVAVE